MAHYEDGTRDHPIAADSDIELGEADNPINVTSPPQQRRVIALPTHQTLRRNQATTAPPPQQQQQDPQTIIDNLRREYGM